MEKRKKIRKLVLKRETISILNEDGMNKVKGGLFSFTNLVGANFDCANEGNHENYVDTKKSDCGTCGGDTDTGFGMCCNNATMLCYVG